MPKKPPSAKEATARRRPKPTARTTTTGGPIRTLRQAERPPYTVPTMDAVRALPWNGLTVASTFAGGGGSSTGYRMAGYRVAYANEFVDSARETYAANKAPDAVLDGRDVRKVTAEDILERTGLDVGELDVLDGSPPCSAFSTAGKRHEGWGVAKGYSDGRTQVVDDLFFEYARLVDGLRPRVFVAENVSGLVKGSARGYFLRILEALKAPGYRVSARLLDASLLGVPQARQRLIFVGVREDLGRDPAHPAPLPYRVTLRDALRPEDAPLPGPDGTLLDRETRDRVDLLGMAIGREAKALAPGAQSSRYFQLVRPSIDRPAPTITATAGARSAAGPLHPDGDRKFTLGELRAVSGFPPDYTLRGDFRQRWERLGRSVPPLMMRAIAETVAREILDA